MKTGARSIAIALCLSALSGAALLHGCIASSEAPPHAGNPAIDTGTPATDTGDPDTGTETSTGPTDTGQPDTGQCLDVASGICPDNSACGWSTSAPTKTKRSVCTRAQTDSCATDCWGPTATAATCNAYKAKVSAACFECSAVTAANDLGYADSAACAQIIDKTSACGKKLQTLTNCQALVCGTPAPGDCIGFAEYDKCVVTDSVKSTGACRTLATAAVDCKSSSKFANCFATTVDVLRKLLYTICGNGL